MFTLNNGALSTEDRELTVLVLGLGKLIALGTTAPIGTSGLLHSTSALIA